MFAQARAGVPHALGQPWKPDRERATGAWGRGRGQGRDRRATRDSAERVRFVSGYTGDVALRCEVMAERTAFLAKPFTPNQLGHEVQELLDAPAS